MRILVKLQVSVTVLFFISCVSFAQDTESDETLPESAFPEGKQAPQVPSNSTPKTPRTEKPKQAVMNFEGDMIEGEKRQPDLFVQTNVQKLDLDSVLYLRKDFNDF